MAEAALLLADERGGGYCNSPLPERDGGNRAFPERGGGADERSVCDDMRGRRVS